MRPFITWLAILGYSLVALGLPLPLAGGDGASDPVVRQLLAAKDRSVRFPCMDKPCGCASARQCFRDCCCTTSAERLAWARRNGLEVELLAALETRISTERPTDPSGACDTPAASCCSAKPPRESPPPGRHLPSRQVTLRAMLACQGVVSSWIAVGASLPPPRIELGTLLRLSERLVILDVTAQSPPPDPVVPPPWAA